MSKFDDQAMIEAASVKIKQAIAEDPGIIHNPDGSVTIELDQPFTYAEQKIERVTLSRPKGKHLKKFMKTDDVFELCAELGDIPSSAWDEMDAADVTLATGVAGSFLDRRPRTGGSASRT